MQRKYFTDGLRKMYWTEKRLLRLLPALARAASTRYLEASFMGHYHATQLHVKRLEQVFSLLDEKPLVKKCPIMESILNEARGVVKTTEKNTMLRDLGLIMAAQKIEDYEMGSYTRLVSLADKLAGLNGAVLLEEILNEEKEAAETFAAVKEDTLNDEWFEEISREAVVPLDSEQENAAKPVAMLG